MNHYLQMAITTSEDVEAMIENEGELGKLSIVEQNNLGILNALIAIAEQLEKANKVLYVLVELDGELDGLLEEDK